MRISECGVRSERPPFNGLYQVCRAGLGIAAGVSAAFGHQDLVIALILGLIWIRLEQTAWVRGD